MRRMLLVGLTGGIGAGKSTVAGMLADRGAVIIDADELAREALDPGSPGFDAVVREFGPELVGVGGEIDRARLGKIVFADEGARRRLEGIVHPEVASRFAAEADRYRDTDRIVLYVVPLLVERALQDLFDVVVVVAADPAARTARLSAAREMTDEEIRGRMGAQLADEERERAADVVIRNDGSIEDLERQVDELWRRLAVTPQR
jgi:dephospho-CoA kinase